MIVYDFIKECEYDVKITDYVTEEELFKTDSIIEHYDEIKNSVLGRREVAFVSAQGDCIVVRAFSPLSSRG